MGSLVAGSALTNPGILPAKNSAERCCVQSTSRNTPDISNPLRTGLRPHPLAKGNIFHNRPHPYPLPQERENRSTVARGFGFVQLAAHPQAKLNEGEIAREAIEFSATPDCCSLSPGEWVRVRASVNTFLFPSPIQTPNP
jgi:hypothetical protein